jgi:CRISPR-associated endonuclease Csn1
MQLGRCAYTNKPINLDDIFSNTYDIDHIIPQSFLKDDSLNNRVLVFGNANKEKGNSYPVPQKFRSIMLPVWKHLKDNGLLSSEKYTRLTRNTSLSEDELGAFINRQLVFTNQSVKVLAEILAKQNPKSRVIYSKASNVSEFRQKFDILKSREINDLHHAEDAYLNIVVGNVFNSKFGYDAIRFLKTHNHELITTNTKKIYDKDIANAWISDGSTLKTVKKMVFRNDKLFTRMSTKKTGSLFNDTIYPKSKDLYPVKETKDTPLIDTSKYGGVSGLNNAYFSIVKSFDKKGREIITLEAIPIIFANRVDDKKLTLKQVLETYHNLKQPSVLIEKILINSLIDVDGSRVFITGKSDSSILIQNATQVYAEYQITKYFRAITKYKQNKNLYIIKPDMDELVLSIREGEVEDIRLTKTENLRIYDFILDSIKKPFFANQSIGNYVGKLSDSRDNFAELDIGEQALTLLEMVSLIRCNASKSNLQSIAEKSKFLGKNTINKKITNTNFKIIDQSITGFFEKIRWSN